MTDSIVNDFPLIVNTVLALTPEEELELQMLYGKCVVLDIDLPKNITGTPFKTGYVFRIHKIQLASGLQDTTFITSCTEDRDSSYNFFKDQNNMKFTSHGMKSVDLETNTQQIIEHNNTWRLTPQDEGYYDLNIGFEHLKNRTVTVSKKRYQELAQTYGYNFFIMDVDFGHHKVDEGYLFWKHFSNNSLFVTSSPELQNGMIYFGPRSYGKVAPFCGDFTLEDVWSGEQSADFNKFWKLKAADKGYKKYGTFDEYSVLASTLNANTNLIPDGFYKSLSQNIISWKCERYITHSDVNFIENILNRKRDSDFCLISPSDDVMVVSIFSEGKKLKVYSEFETDDYKDVELSFSKVSEVVNYLKNIFHLN